MTRALNLIVSLCVFMTVIMPVVNSFRFFTDGRSSFEVDISGTPSQTQDTFTDLWKEETEKEISNAVFRKTGIKPKTVSIELSVDAQNVAAIDKVEIVTDNLTEDKQSVLENAVAALTGSGAKIYISESNNENIGIP